MRTTREVAVGLFDEAEQAREAIMAVDGRARADPGGDARTTRPLTSPPPGAPLRWCAGQRSKYLVHTASAAAFAWSGPPARGK